MSEIVRDLHLHLSGAVDPVVLWELIKRQGFKTRSKDFWSFHDTLMIDRKTTHDLNGYLDVLHFIDRAQSSPEMVELSVYNAFVSSFLGGATYLELRFNPAKRSQNGAIDLDSIIVSARAGMERAQNVFGIEGSLILCLGRDMSREANFAVTRKAIQYHKKGVSGIDIAGPYKGPPADLPQNMWMNYFCQQYAALDLENCFLEAQQAGLRTTVHCGETDFTGVLTEVDYALTVLKPDRIGHGIQMAKSPELMEKAKGKTLEVCITSNLATGAVKDLTEMREILSTFKKVGLGYTICTDATFLLRTTIKREQEIWTGLWKS